MFWVSAALAFLASIYSRLFSLNICTIQPNLNGQDDTPSILDAFRRCGNGGRVNFLNATYHIDSVMNTTGLMNCVIDVQGTLLWSANISYWLSNSYKIGYQNQSTAWLLGGNSITLQGHGYGTLDGNGQTWYNFNGNRSNLIGRPHALTITNTKNSLIEGIRFVQPQMWAMTVMNSRNVTLQDIYVNATSSSYNTTGNTDDANTVYADSITFLRWTVDNGDDGIALKANSTNILIEDSAFYHGHGVALGSIGQFPDRYERIENVTVRNVDYFNTGKSIYLKTWTGKQKGYPPNGGGGGKGYVRNILLQNATLHNTRSIFAIDQCISCIGDMDDCDTSHLALSNINFQNVRGVAKTSGVFQCSAETPCRNVSLVDISVVDPNGKALNKYQCIPDNLNGASGITCSGPPQWEYIKYVRNHDTSRDQ